MSHASSFSMTKYTAKQVSSAFDPLCPLSLFKYTHLLKHGQEGAAKQIPAASVFPAGCGNLVLSAMAGLITLKPNKSYEYNMEVRNSYRLPSYTAQF